MTAPALYAGERRADIEVQYTEPRDRVTVGFRLILAIPHAVLVALWGYAVGFAAIGQWFVILFTGRRNRGIWDFQNNWLAYASRVNGYELLLYDPWPPIGDDTSGTTPTRYAFRGTEEADRLTNGLRLIWAIPALIVWYLVAIGGFFVAVASWFAIVFTGRHPQGMWDFLHKVVRYYTQFSSYTMLMTDTYPSWSSAEPPAPTTQGSGPGRSGPGAAAPGSAMPGSPLPPPG